MKTSRRRVHSWKIGYREAVRIQDELKGNLILDPLRRGPRLVAGADASYEKGGDILYGAVVVFSVKPWAVVEKATARGKVSFPYIPGLLSFREAPVLLGALGKLRLRPDLIIFDSQGIAHPRGFGLASHIGLLLDIPTIGCAKSRLVGAYRQPALKAGCSTHLLHDGRRIGTVLRTRDSVKPVFVSPGHRIDHGGAVRWVLKCCMGYRLPEPTRQAHILVNLFRKERNGK